MVSAGLQARAKGRLSNPTREISSKDKAKSYIKDVKQYIDDTIRNLYEMDELLGINWKGKEGKDFIDKKCKECYELIQAFEEV